MRYPLRRACRALAPLLPALAAALALALPQPVSASGHPPDYITVASSYVTIGAPFTVQITLATHPQRQSIVLRVERAAAASQPPCGAAQLFPGLAPVSIAGQVELHLTWPAALGTGDYALCATSAADESFLAATVVSFTVFPAGSTPTPMPTPAPTAYFATGDINYRAGDSVNLDVSNWPAALTAGPTNVLVKAVADYTFSEKAVFVASQDGRSVYLVSITLPSDLPRGNDYAAIYSGAVLVVQSEPFLVAPPATQIRPITGGPISAPGGSIAPSALIVAVAALLLLAVALLARPAAAGHAGRRR